MSLSFIRGSAASCCTCARATCASASTRAEEICKRSVGASSGASRARTWPARTRDPGTGNSAPAGDCTTPACAAITQAARPGTATTSPPRRRRAVKVRCATGSSPAAIPRRCSASAVSVTRPNADSLGDAVAREAAFVGSRQPVLDPRMMHTSQAQFLRCTRALNQDSARRRVQAQVRSGFRDDMRAR